MTVTKDYEKAIKQTESLLKVTGAYDNFVITKDTDGWRYYLTSKVYGYTATFSKDTGLLNVWFDREHYDQFARISYYEMKFLLLIDDKLGEFRLQEVMKND